MQAKRTHTMADLLAKDGAAVLGSAAPCPHCGAAAREYPVTTPRLGWKLTFWIPPTRCCAKSRQA